MSEHPVTPDPDAVLIGDGMTGGYGSGADILHDCTIAVDKGQIAVIVGPNGAGKSTAMKAVFGMLNLRKGQVRLNGEDITALTPQARVAKGMGFVPQTNNIFVWARPDTDVLCDKVRTGRTVEEVREATQKLQHIIHDECIFVPAWSGDFMRIGSWRWARWPDCENTRFSPPVVYDPHESFVFWIDEEMLADTREAMRTNRKFPESNRIVDEYRLPSPGQTPS